MSVKSLTGFDVNGQRITSLGDPSSSTDAANKSYVDNVAAGLKWKDNVRVASTTNVTLATPGSTINGVTMVAGDRVLLKDQTTAAENGIYLWNGAAVPMTRTTDADTASEIKSAAVRTSEGTVAPDTMYQMITDGTIVLNTTALSWTQFGGGTSYTADGNGLELSGTIFGVELDGTTLTKGPSGLRIGSGAAGDGLVEASGVLAVNPGTGLTIASDQVKIDTSVVARKYAADCGTTNPWAVTHGLGTQDVVVQVIENSTKKVVLADVVLTSSSVATIDLGGTPTSAQYRVEITG